MLLTEIESPAICPFCNEIIMEARQQLLNIGKQAATSKLGKELGAYTFDMLAGHDCRGAGGCFGAAAEKPGEKTPTGQQALKVIHCPPGYTPEEWNKKMGISADEKFTCFGAPLQRKPNVYKSHKENSDMMKHLMVSGTVEEMADLIRRSIDAKLPRAAKYFRIHAIGGDFLSKKYRDAWIKVAGELPEITFYTYTKMAILFIKNDGGGENGFSELELPDNMNIVLSANGANPPMRKLILDYGQIPETERKYKLAWVVRSEEEAKERGLLIDHDDVMAATGKHDFAILIHGEQMKGSQAGKDVYKAKKKEKSAMRSYNAMRAFR